jgi:hypothetical protein
MEYLRAGSETELWNHGWRILCEHSGHRTIPILDIGHFRISVVHISRIYERLGDYDGRSTFPERLLSGEVVRD